VRETAGPIGGGEAAAGPSNEATDDGLRIATRFDPELAFAVDVSVAAGRLLMDHYEHVERIDYKSSRDVVTEVDHLSESMILGAIRETFPGDGILAEESGAHRRRDGSNATTTRGRTWVVDPLDGTVNYANGIPFFCVSVALVVDGRPTVGVVRDPTRGETFAATVDTVTTLEGRPVAPSAKEQLSDYVISLALGGRSTARRAQAIRRAVRIPRSMGSAALALAYVANGRFDAFVQQVGLSAWDVAAAGLIAERAGAVVTDFDAGPWFDLARDTRRLGVVAAPGSQHAAILALATGRTDPPGSTDPRP
jgi:myo-inositol-1(or 4)-monophosphatase